MSLLDDRAASVTEEVGWLEFLRQVGVTGRAERTAPLTCSWVPDPALPERMICVWGPGQTA